MIDEQPRTSRSLGQKDGVSGLSPSEQPSEAVSMELPPHQARGRAGGGNAYWTIAQLSVRWQVSTRTVRRLIETGRLRAVRIGGQLRVADDVLRRFDERCVVTPHPRQRTLRRN
jgi:excisionase family DNA binding protein